jgi:hypothetical protein
MLENSPRLKPFTGGLRVEVSAAEGVAICINDSSGATISCYTVSPERQTAEISASELVQSFHSKVFGLGFDISKAQRSMLLGSSVILSSQNDASLQRNRDTILQR